MNLLTAIITAVGLLLFVAALISLPVMLLWDWLMPTIFGLPEITWFQAWGLLFLCGLLFKSNITTKQE
jgi:hypothetical protein